MTGMQAEFSTCLKEISFARLGWDVQLPTAQRSKEAAVSNDHMTRAREIWAENEGLRDDLRAVFREARHLVELREIEDAA